MISPEKVSTDVYANMAKQEHVGISICVGAGALSALAVGVEHFEELEGKGLLAGAVVMGAIACRSLNKALRYSFREGQLHDH